MFSRMMGAKKAKEKNKMQKSGAAIQDEMDLEDQSDASGDLSMTDVIAKLFDDDKEDLYKDDDELRHWEKSTDEEE